VIAAQHGADPLARFERPRPAPDAPFHVRVQWMRQGARLMVRTIALDAVLQPTGDHSRYVEALGAVQAFGLRCRASNAEIIAATEGEWKAATDYCGRFIEAVRRALWWRCKARQPRDVIEAAAKDIACRGNVPISDNQLHVLLGNIWEAAAPWAPRKGRGRAR